MFPDDLGRVVGAKDQPKLHASRGEVCVKRAHFGSISVRNWTIRTGENERCELRSWSGRSVQHVAWPSVQIHQAAADTRSRFARERASNEQQSEEKESESQWSRAKCILWNICRSSPQDEVEQYYRKRPNRRVLLPPSGDIPTLFLRLVYRGPAGSHTRISVLPSKARPSQRSPKLHWCQRRQEHGFRTRGWRHRSVE